MSTFINRSMINIGDERIVAADSTGHGFSIGSRVRVIGFDPDGDAWVDEVEDDGSLRGRSGHWFPGLDDLVEEGTTPARPVIDFGPESRATAREYARSVNSRVLKAESQRALAAVGRGEEVDAYALNAALTDAMSSCATRAGQSMARREMTKKVRHLAYIVQGVLENHANGLPPMEPGARSPRIAALEEGLRNAEALLSTIRNERDAEIREVVTRNGALAQQVETLKAEVIVANQGEAQARDETTALAGTLEAAHQRLEAVLDHARTAFGDLVAERLIGVAEGHVLASVTFE